MARMGSYCRAYYARDFAAFAGWNPDHSQLQPAAADADGGEAQVPRTALEDGDIVYLQEDLSVTDGIFLDEHVLFADNGPEWRAFCLDMLGFDVTQGAESHPEPQPGAASA